MRIIGFNLSKVSIERQEKLEGKLEIKQNINVDNIEKQKKALKGEAYRLQEAIKDFLELEKIKEEPEGQGDFFPIRGIGE